MPDRKRARELAAEFNRKGDPTGWFEPLYQEGEAGKSVVPWVDLCPNPHLLGFWNAHPQQSSGKSALVVGCALGDDAEQLASWGFHTTAFDISETAIRTARKRYPNSKVNYIAADLFAAPASWQRNFDFVLEAYTLQALPAALRPQAIENISSFLSLGGLLLVIARGRDPSEPEGQMPWPLTRNELSAFTSRGLKELSFDTIPDISEPEVQRFRVLYTAEKR
jgi:2-polyprenyl-3-methyl-5-hydroxy-6-metoxy-1,4-benzoquinol methylase